MKYRITNTKSAGRKAAKAWVEYMLEWQCSEILKSDLIPENWDGARPHYRQAYNDVVRKYIRN